MKLRRLYLLLFACLFALPAFALEKKLTIRDYTGRGFAPDLVQYRLISGGMTLKRLRVYDGAGKPVAHQISQTEGEEARTLSFLADLPANGLSTYVLRDDARGPVPETALRATAGRDGLVFSNRLLNVRLPRPVDRTWKEPVAVDQIPAPILAFKSGTSDWLGQSSFLTDMKVRSLKIELTEKGPVFAELRYEIRWAQGGYYRARVRVIQGVPIVKIREEYDVGKLDGDHYWQLDLTKGWSPDRVAYARTMGNGVVGSSKVEKLDFFKGRDIWYLVPDSAWGTPLSHVGFYKADEKGQMPPAAPVVGYVPLHKGDWRRMNAVELHSADPSDVRLRFRLTPRHASWLREVTSETSPFSMQEHEPGLSKTYSRRRWGLALGRPAMDIQKTRHKIGPFYALRMFYGVVGLDTYKDYVFEWDRGETTHPRLYMRAENLPALRQALRNAPLPETYKEKVLSYSYALSQNDKVAERRLEHLMRRLHYLCRLPVISPTIGHHQTSQSYEVAAQADDLLSWPNLPEDARHEILARIALINYWYGEPDVMGYLGGSHTGNPNMGTARFMSADTFLALVPRHPMFEGWRKHRIEYTQYKMSTQTAPGGGYFEYGSAYHMHGYARTTNSLPCLEVVGADEMLARTYPAYHQPNWDYYMNLLTPVDPRWQSRMIPGMANSPPGNTEHFIEAAGSFQKRMPEFASKQLWAWLANGAYERTNVFITPLQTKPQEAELRSRVYPGVGVIFRAHQGPNETYMLFRSGFNWSHWYIDQGHFILMSRGSVLVPFQPYQYWWSPNKQFDMYNQIRFGHPTNTYPFAWPDSNIIDYAFGESVDYAWSSSGYPDWYITPGATEPFRKPTDAPVAKGQMRPLAEEFGQTEGAFTWNRQITFLKGKSADSPNYFVMRDAMPGKGRLASYFFLNLLGDRQDVKVKDGRVLVDTEWPVDLDMRFVEPKKITPEFYEELQPIAAHGANWRERYKPDWRISEDWVSEKGESLKKQKNMNLRRLKAREKHVFLRINQPPGEGYLSVLYLRKQDEPEPTISRLAEGALKIEHPEGTDYVFLSPTHKTFKGEQVDFAGRSGAVRIRNDNRVVLALTGGQGHVGYKGHIIESIAPVELILPIAELTPGMRRVVAEERDIIRPPEKAQSIAPGVSKWTDGEIIRYAVGSDTPVSFRDDTVSIEAGSGMIEIAPDHIRFVVGLPTYARLTVGETGIRGVGPFDLTFTDDTITGKVYGRRRSLACTWPKNITRPMFQMDGLRYYAGWADDPSFKRFGGTPQFAFAFGVTAGEHEIRVSDWTYPAPPPTVPRRTLSF